MKYRNIREEELKNKVANDYFWIYDCTKIIGNVDFCVCIHQSQKELFEQESLLWAEAKKGISDIFKSIVQLILTIGKARTFDKFLPPPFLGAFDSENIAFIPYVDIYEVFYINDFNWNVTPSNYETKEFKLIHEKVKSIIDSKALLFNFQKDDKELKRFIKDNFIVGKLGLTKTKIDKNNFIIIYNKWLQSVKPTIGLNWDLLKNRHGIIDGDFYLADLLSHENKSLREKLYVLLNNNHYLLDREINELGFLSSKRADFLDKQIAHTQFWNKYERPPKEEYWDYIVERRDLLVPQDVRERKGSFFTPQIWVELSQKYLTDVLGEDWQDEYYIWDCAAGTGNLLAGLSNKYNIWASTLDKQDVEVMHDRINNGANLLDDHVFQFDFLNDEFLPISKGGKLPDSLYQVISNENKRKKLVIYINPPYAEASDKKTLTKIEGKRGVEQSKTNLKYAKHLGQGNAELFVQFLTRIYFEIPESIIAEFSTLKIISGPHFINFRSFFKAKMEKAFICPAQSFDNVKGKFPIGFMIWDTSKKVKYDKIETQVFDENNTELGKKNFYVYDKDQYINDWIKPYRADVSKNQLIGKFPFKGSDFQNQNMIQVVHHKMDYNTEAGQFFINQKNIIYACVYFAVRKCIDASWLNDRDQFLAPNKNWESDLMFQSDCLTYTLFTNNIQSSFGTNHWIPFTEKEIDAKEKFESSFMTKFISGKIDTEISFDLFQKIDKKEEKPLQFSTEAKSVFDVGRELWKFYHKQPNCNVNASLYDIREYFQGRNEAGKMNNKSQDKTYMILIGDLREKLNKLAEKIEPKVYEYRFLKE
ncbi:MAG: hypothetical protein EAZ53_05735 [Bacteroidetes bacterium]|nr:MAG: hypothetical protein EAZ53_05735 [Bacteroidota bacterium]